MGARRRATPSWLRDILEWGRIRHSFPYLLLLTRNDPVLTGCADAYTDAGASNANNRNFNIVADEQRFALTPQSYQHKG